MAKIKNLLFDMGAVLINIDYNKTIHAFQEIGINDFGTQFSQTTASPIFESLETGKITEVAFYQQIQSQCSNTVDSTAIKNAWNAILEDFRKESMDFLFTLKKEYRLFLLSNTNAIHLDEVNLILQKQLGVNQVDDYFEKAYYSHKVGMRKPNADIFEFVLEDANINAAETLFIDDTQMNINTATTLGFKTHLLLAEERIELLTYY